MTEFDFIADDGRDTFTPLDADGRPTGAPVEIRSIIEVLEPSEDERWGHAAAALAEEMRGLTSSFRTVAIAIEDAGAIMFADLYKAFTGKRWRPSKAHRRRAKRRKLAQRREARNAPRSPGEDWRAAAPLHRAAVSSIAKGRPSRPHPRTGYVHINKGDNNSEH